MTYVPSPQTIKCAFDTRAEAAAAYVDSQIKYIFVGPLMYSYDASGTALTTAGGRTWSPAGQISPQHWAENTIPGTTDMTSACLAAATRASSLAPADTMSNRIKIDLRGEDIGIAETGDDGGLVIAALDGIEFTNGRFVAIGVWSGTDKNIVKVMSSGGDKARSVWFSNVNFEGNRVAACIQFDNTQFCGMTDVTGHGFISHGVRSTTSNGAFAMTRVYMREWLFTESGMEDQNNRVAIGLDIDTADGTMTDCGASLCGTAFEKGSGYNMQIQNLHVWNGCATVNENPDTQYIMKLDDPRNIMLNGGYFDHGVIYINADNLDSGSGTLQFVQIVNAMFPRSGAILSAGPRIIITTSVTNNDLAGLSLIGCFFERESENIRFSTTGAGSYSPNLKWTFLACRQFDGTAVTSNVGNLDQSIDGYLRFGASGALTVGRSGDATVQADGALTLMGDYDNDAAAVSSQVRFGVNGTVYSRMESSGGISNDRPFMAPSYTVATLPAAATYPSGVIRVTDETGGDTLAFSDGTNWRRLADRAVVS